MRDIIEIILLAVVAAGILAYPFAYGVVVLGFWLQSKHNEWKHRKGR